MRATANALLAGMIAFCWGVTDAQVRPATEAEAESIRTALMLDEIPAWRDRRVMQVQGAFTEGTGDRPRRLDGWVYFRPSLAQDSLCAMEASFITGIGKEVGYDWSVERFAYWNWVARTGSECEIEDRSQVPDTAVQSNEPIPTSAMAYILVNSNELLTLAYNHVAAATETPEAARNRLLAYQANTSYRLERIELTEQSSPEYGFAFRATYQALSQSEGPSVIFSVTLHGFLVHDVGVWMA